MFFLGMISEISCEYCDLTLTFNNNCIESILKTKIKKIYEYKYNYPDNIDNLYNPSLSLSRPHPWVQWVEWVQCVCESGSESESERGGESGGASESECQRGGASAREHG